ncbi:MAG TPA: hypothetical protein PLE88_13240 [Anaerohalosphaeraceae bacterium]|nr:hypothetical protein [Anaerohalosphaeraceae bacterium]
MDIIETAQKIEDLIKALSAELERSEGLIAQKAETAAAYDKAAAVQAVRMKEDGLPVGLIDKIVKGKLADLNAQKILAEETLRAHFWRLEVLMAQLNGYQSINKYLNSTE